MKKLLTFFFLFVFTSFLSSQTGWTEVTSGTTLELQGIDWANASVVWVTATDGSVFKSTNAGTSWTAAGSCGGGAGAYSIAAIDAQTAVVSFGPNSGDGKIYRTTNGGTNWTQVFTQAGAWFNFVDNINSNELWSQSDPISGNFLIVRSTNGGANWFPITTPVPMAAGAGAYNSFYRIGTKLWFGTSSSPKIFYSHNGPEGPWVSSNASANNVGTIAFNGVEGNGLAAFWSNSTTINRTTDGGHSWTTQTTAIGTPNFFDYVVGTNNAWAATSTGIWKTTDNGATWIQDVPSTTAINAVKFFNDASVGIAVGVGGKIYKSTMQPLISQFLTHNTGNLKACVFNNGYIGHSYDGSTGGGVIVGTNPDAMYTAGVIIGDPTNGVNGMVGSFTSASGQPPIIQDMVNQYGLFGFSSNTQYNQVTSGGYKDDLAVAPYGLMVHQESFSNTNDKFVFLRYKIQNNTLTPKNNIKVGIFADWDVGATNYAKNRGGVDIARNLVYQYLNTAPINDPNYYGIVALNGLTGGRLSSEFPGSNETLRGEIFNYIATINDSAVTADGDYRSYIGSGPFNIAVGQEILVGFAIVYGSSLADLQANALLAYQKGNSLVPVELTSFTASVIGTSVNLNWITATETNNHRFEIERKVVEENSQWVTIGFRQGAGTTAQETQYSFVDNLEGINAKQIAYRIKQYDYDGKYAYSKEILVDNTVPSVYNMAQNYPNPFNPTTSIKYQIPTDNFVSLKVYNTLGEEVATLVNSFVKAGSYEVNFDASNLSSGIYLYTIKVGNNEFVKTNKMVLMK